MKFILTLLISITLVSCSTIRMSYQGEFKTQEGKTGHVTAEKSYDMGDADSTLCILTGIFFGGYCWFYTVMPTTQQRQQMQSDVQSAITDHLKSNQYTLTTLRNDKMSFEKGEDILRIDYNFNKSIFKTNSSSSNP